MNSFVACLVLFMVGCTAQKTKPAAEQKPAPSAEEQKKAEPKKAKASEMKPSVVAVWDFDPLLQEGGGNPELGEALAARAIEALSKKPGYTVVERQRLLTALQELNLGTTSLVDESTRLKLGRIVGAQLMVFGGYQVIGDSMRLDLRLVNVETGAVVKASDRTVPASNISGWFEAARDAAAELVEPGHQD